MTSPTGTRTIVIGVVALMLAGVVAVIAVVLIRSTSSEMTGMHHGSDDVSMSSPAATTSADPHGDMPGMDMSGTGHGAEATPSASPTTADPHGDMPGMDMGSGDTHGTTPAPGDTHGTTPAPGDSHGTTPGHAAEEEVAPDRPIVPVLGTFGGGTSAVLLAAGLLRRKDRIRNEAKAASRAARRSAK